MTSKEKTCKVFCYGTLKKGHRANDIITEAGGTFVGETKTKPEFTMVSLGWYPAVFKEGNTSILGEVYEIPEKTLTEVLDRYEGYPTLYSRELIETEFGEAWLYFMNKDTLSEEVVYPKIEDGNWT